MQTMESLLWQTGTYISLPGTAYVTQALLQVARGTALSFSFCISPGLTFSLVDTDDNQEGKGIKPASFG